MSKRFIISTLFSPSNTPRPSLLLIKSAVVVRLSVAVDLFVLLVLEIGNFGEIICGGISVVFDAVETFLAFCIGQEVVVHDPVVENVVSVKTTAVVAKAVVDSLINFLKSILFIFCFVDNEVCVEAVEFVTTSTVVLDIDLLNLPTVAASVGVVAERVACIFEIFNA